MAIEKLNQSTKSKVNVMEKTIVKMPSANEFPIFEKLDYNNKQLFEYCLKNSDRFVYFESVSEITDYLKNLSMNERFDIVNRLKNSGFAYKKVKLSEAAPEQKILFIFDKGLIK
jgi:hypothetical protein